MIKYIKHKQFKNVISYTLTLVASALAGIIIFPYSIIHIFFSYRGEGIKTSLLDFQSLALKIVENVRLINTEIFHGYGYIMIILAIIICIIWIFAKKKRLTNKRNSTIKFITIPMAMYLVFSIVCSPYIDIRYLMPIIPLIFCSIIYVFYDILKDITSIRNVFCIILTISICFAITVIPKLSNNLYTYRGHKETLEFLENELSNEPMIYIYEDYSAQYNKTMECYEALTKVDNTYIMEKENFSLNKVKNVLKDVDSSNGILVMMHYRFQDNILNELLSEEILTTTNYIGRLGRFVIFELK